MAAKPWYQDAELLSAELARAGSWAQLARDSGIAVSTLKHWGGALGLNRTMPVGAEQKPVIQTLDPDPALVQENTQLKRQIRQLSEGEIATERVVRRLEAAVAEVRPIYQPRAYTPVQGLRTSQELVLLFSDTHASEVVSLEETRGINEYNWPIMLERMDDIRTGILSHKEHFGFEVSKLHVFLLGDMLSGDIHDELAITNDRPTAEAVVQFAADTSRWLESLADEFGCVHLAGVVGNHPRATKKPAAKMAHNNGDWLYYKLLEAYLREDVRFSFDFPRGSFNVQMICDRWRALLMHGDGIRSSMPGVPWGGVQRRVTTLEQQFSKSREPIDYVFMGHWHSKNSLDGISSETYINGSVKGVDEYGLRSFGSGRDACQTLLSFHPDRGVTGSYQLHLQERRPGSDGWTV